MLVVDLVRRSDLDRSSKIRVSEKVYRKLKPSGEPGGCDHGEFLMVNSRVILSHRSIGRIGRQDKDRRSVEC
jgi:hypothetical protein